MATQTPQRRFEFKDDTSYKFWSIQLVEQVAEVTFGRIGSKGKRHEKRFASSDAAEDYAEKKIAEKLKQGYQEVARKPVIRKSNAELWTDLKDHEPLIQSILQTPDNPDGYLVYADWLMERGDPRGEFILCQWKLADYETPLRDIESLKNQAAEIYSEHWREWVGEAASFLNQNLLSLQFERGWVDQITVKNSRSTAALCLKESPLTRTAREFKILNNKTTSASMLDDFLLGLKTYAKTDLGNVRHFSPGTKTPSQLAGATFDLMQTMPRLQKLTLNQSFAKPDLRRLFQKELPQLEHLRIEEQNGSTTVSNLCRSDWLEQLRTIELSCQLSDSACQQLAESLDPVQIETLYVSNAIHEENINLFEKSEINVIPE